MTRKFPPVLVLAAILLLTSACATKPLATDGTAVIEPDQGLLAVRFISNWKGNESAWHEELAFGVRLDGASVNEVFEMRSSDDAQLIAIPAGEYEWIQATIGSSYIAFDSHTGFSIEPGQVTYVGDVTLDVRHEPFVLVTEQFNVVDNGDETMALLRSEYGTLLDDFSLSVQIAEITLSTR